MLKKILLTVLLLIPVMAGASGHQGLENYLYGKWQVEGIRSKGEKKFHPPRHMMKWQFKHKGILIEEVGSNGARVTWNYRVVGRDIKVRAAQISFSWHVLGMENKLMLVRHQLGLLKVRRM